MPVDTPHQDYTDNLLAWQAIEDAIAGARTIKRRGVTYLPIIYGMEATAYEAYKTRANWFNATSRTHEAWVGMLTRKEAQTTTPDSLADFLEDCDQQGAEWRSYEEQIIRALCSTSRAGTLIDWNADENRPYLRHYAPADIINWRIERIKSRPCVTRVVLREFSDEFSAATGDVAPKDSFATPAYPQWRVLERDKATGAVTWKVWRKKNKSGTSAGAFGGVSSTTGPFPVGPNSVPAGPNPTGTADDDFIAIEEGELQRRGQTLPGVPFVFHGIGQNRVDVTTPMLGDIAELNISHYRGSADLENGLHLCGIPTPWAAGFTDEDTDGLLLGCTKVWCTEEPTAKCGFLEFSGSGLQPLKQSLDDKERQMAILGARVMMPDKSQQETATAVKIRAVAETSSLSTVGASASRSLSEVLNWAAWWIGTETTPADLAEEAYTIINKELVAGSADANEITAIVNAYLQGAMSYETLFFNFQKANLYPDDVDMEEEQELIEEQKPAPPAEIPGLPKPVVGAPGPEPAPIPKEEPDPESPKPAAKKAAKKKAKA